MVVSTDPQRPVIGWLVDPLLDQDESGVECISNAPPNKWQWRADDYRVQEEIEDGREDSIERSGNREREGAVEDEREAGSTVSTLTDKKKKSIFRKLTRKIRLKRVSSTDAVMSQEASMSNEMEEKESSRIMAMRNTPVLPSMIHLQRVSSRDSVECVLADVFMLPSSSSNLTEEGEFSNNGSMTSTGTVVIDEQAQQVDFSHIQALPPCNIQVPTEGAVECLLSEKDASSLPSTSSSILTAQDSGSDDEQRMEDLKLMMWEGDGPAEHCSDSSTSASEQTSQYSDRNSDRDLITNLSLMLLEISADDDDDEEESESSEQGDDVDSVQTHELMNQQEVDDDLFCANLPIFCFNCHAEDQDNDDKDVRVLIQPSSSTYRCSSVDDSSLSAGSQCS